MRSSLENMMRSLRKNMTDVGKKCKEINEQADVEFNKQNITATECRIIKTMQSALISE